MSGEPINRSGTGLARLATIRRLYFYILALISLWAGLSGLSGLLEMLSDVWLSSRGTIYDVNNFGYVRNQVALSGGLLLVAMPIFLVHWGYIQRRQSEAGERGAALRKLFLYAASALAVGYAFVAGFQLLREAAKLALGIPLDETPLWPSHWFHWSTLALLGGFLRLYFHDVLVQDGDLGREIGRAGLLRRLYQAIVGLVGLGLAVFGAGQILEVLWRIGADKWQPSVAEGLAMLIVGSLLWRANWRGWQAIAAANPPEASMALRRFYLYASVVVCALGTLVPAANLVQEILLRLFGIGDGLTSSLAYVPLSLVAWWWHWRYLTQEAERYGESPEGATVRRLYYYLVAATGLVLLWIGIVDVLLGVLDWLLVSGTSEAGELRARLLANGLSLLAVGAPIWSLHWRAMESLARQEGRTGLMERSSGPRRAYLYGVSLVGALVILGYLVTVVYRLLLLLLGDPEADFLSMETAGALVRSGVAAVFWVIHLWAIRRDTQMGVGVPEVEPVEVSIEERRVALQARIEQLKAELAAAQAELARLT